MQSCGAQVPLLMAGSVLMALDFERQIERQTRALAWMVISAADLVEAKGSAVFIYSLAFTCGVSCHRSTGFERAHCNRKVARVDGPGDH